MKLKLIVFVCATLLFPALPAAEEGPSEKDKKETQKEKVEDAEKAEATDGQEQTDKEAAKTLYRKSGEKYRNGKFAAAAELLRQAYELDPQPTYLYNRIRALEGAGRYRKALGLLNDNTEMFRKAGGFGEVPDLKKALEKKIAEGSEDSTTAEDPKSQSAPTPPTRTKTIVGWSLIGGSALFYGVAGITGSCLLCSKELKSKLPHDNNFNTREKRTIRGHRWITIGSLTLGTAAVVTGTVLLATDKEPEPEPARTKLLVGPRNVGISIKF